MGCKYATETHIEENGGLEKHSFPHEMTKKNIHASKGRLIEEHHVSQRYIHCLRSWQLIAIVSNGG
jgi:hypothetical protein